MFIGDWRDSLPRHVYGSLVLRDILIRGDNYAPPQPGAILQAANYLAFGRLQAGNSTTPTTLDHEQNVFLCRRRRREKSRRAERPLRFVKTLPSFIPANLEFVMKEYRQ